MAQGCPAMLSRTSSTDLRRPLEYPSRPVQAPCPAPSCPPSSSTRSSCLAWMAAAPPPRPSAAHLLAWLLLQQLQPRAPPGWWQPPGPTGATLGWQPLVPWWQRARSLSWRSPPLTRRPRRSSRLAWSGRAPRSLPAPGQTSCPRLLTWERPMRLTQLRMQQAPRHQVWLPQPAAGAPGAPAAAGRQPRQQAKRRHRAPRHAGAGAAARRLLRPRASRRSRQRLMLRRHLPAADAPPAAVWQRPWQRGLSRWRSAAAVGTHLQRRQSSLRARHVLPARAKARSGLRRRQQPRLRQLRQSSQLPICSAWLALQSCLAAAAASSPRPAARRAALRWQPLL